MQSRAQAMEALQTTKHASYRTSEALAEELRVNRNTVAKAYTELESQGVIETLAGKGCFVRATGSPLSRDVRRRLAADTMDEAVVQAHHLQIGRAEFLRLAEARFDEFERRRARAAS